MSSSPGPTPDLGVPLVWDTDYLNPAVLAFFGLVVLATLLVVALVVLSLTLRHLTRPDPAETDDTVDWLDRLRDDGVSDEDDGPATQ